MTYSAEVLADSPVFYGRLGEVAALGTASSSTNFGSEPPANAFDGSASTFWTTNGFSSGWLQNHLTAAAVSTGYTIRRRDDIPNRNPKDWTFEGSNDGSSWTTLDTRSGITWPTAGETKSFSFSNSTAYAYYRLNISANNGDTYLSVAELVILGACLTDASGNNRHGSYTAVTLGATGALTGDTDTAVTFNGTSSHGDVPYDSGMALSTAFTIEAWIKTSGTGFRSIADRDFGSGRVYQFRINSGSLEFVKISGGVVTASQATSINDGAWHHVVATYDGSNIRLYKDGSLLGSPTSAPGTLAGTDALCIGANASSGYLAFFPGDIDEVAYYTSVLSGTRIAAHYTAATTASSAASGTGSLSLSGSGAAKAAATAAGAIALAGTGNAGIAASAAGSVTLSGTGVIDFQPASGAGSIALTGSGATGIGVAGAGSVSLSGAATAAGATSASGSGSLSLTGLGAATLAAAASGSLSLGAVASAFALFVTDLTNAMNGRRRRGRGIATVGRAVAPLPPGRTYGIRYDKAIAYPTPDLVDGRPT